MAETIKQKLEKLAVSHRVIAVTDTLTAFLAEQGFTENFQCSKYLCWTLASTYPQIQMWVKIYKNRPVVQLLINDYVEPDDMHQRMFDLLDPRLLMSIYTHLSSYLDKFYCRLEKNSQQPTTK
jgi:hypothetical protein